MRRNVHHSVEDLNATVQRVLAGESQVDVSAAINIAYRTLKTYVHKHRHDIYPTRLRKEPPPTLPLKCGDSFVDRRDAADWIPYRVKGDCVSRKEHRDECCVNNYYYRDDYRED
ncbi:hypothetical protein H257_07224 [Aphanomyces astaci]|uniref:Uncharacterized protein n=1 Tax=Aphanomyces astaci TaxID=112090 RepID=W4GK48_APHAT|nr:hypothetical protein H257_07224 [Aphanomyces astaci]ETV80042.1 hypothetical protein H257_07224 [Aphanomyces astaci]|eukprot:XP_009830978.1 hypothetical protein H257_07224 [Aphanomyces astaci]